MSDDVKVKDYYRKYTVIVQSVGEEECYYPFLTKNEAMIMARKKALEYPDAVVIIDAGVRASDGQQLYLNQDGFGMSGFAW